VTTASELVALVHKRVTHDKETRREKAAFEKVRIAETRYSMRLRSLARHVGEIVAAFDPDDPEAVRKMRDVLDAYAHAIQPWARSVARFMLADVSRRDEQAWKETTKRMSLGVREELRRADTGRAAHQLMQEQVDLITSIPREAADRVHALAMEGLVSAARFTEVRNDLLRTTHVTVSRANLIARTEVGRAATTFQQARAEAVGSEEYVWRSAEDSDVRPLHRKLNGHTYRWDDPPVSGENEERSHPGAIYNCRCYAEPILPERI